MTSWSMQTALHARSYLRAADVVARGIKGGVDAVDLRMPENFLLGHACELALKSVLISKGYDEAELKAIGHSLMRAIDRCVAEKITIDPEFAKYCEIMDGAHAKYQTRYALEGFRWVGYTDAIAMLKGQFKAIGLL